MYSKAIVTQINSDVQWEGETVAERHTTEWESDRLAVQHHPRLFGVLRDNRLLSLPLSRALPHHLIYLHIWTRCLLIGSHANSASCIKKTQTQTWFAGHEKRERNGFHADFKRGFLSFFHCIEFNAFGTVSYLGQWTLLSQWALVHILEELLQSIPHCRVAPLLSWQIFHFWATTKVKRHLYWV